MLFVVAAMATSAWAQAPGATEPAPQLAPSDEKSELLAGGLSFGLTAAGFTTLLVTARLAEPDQNGRRLTEKYKMPLYLTSGVLLAVGPTSGHIYAGTIWNRGLAVRLVAGTVMVLSAGAIDNCCSEGDHNGNEAAAAVTIIAGIVFLGASVYESATAVRDVRRFNARHASSSSSIAIAPMLSRDQQGLAVVGRF